MVITNFSSGELSARLFGRIDLGQYYQGVSKLENFNVIPTGGISKRNGTRRLAELPANGRLIPFIVDRDNPVIIYLSVNRISLLYPQEDHSVIERVLSITNFNGYRTLEEIAEVQHAQNYKTMVFAHKKYPPIVITLDDNLMPSGRIFVPNVTAEIQTGDDVTERDLNEFLHKDEINEGDDAVYTESRWLTKEDQYPGCVSFFAGRLVFAGTKQSPQRIFVSKVITKPEDIYSFATFQFFLTAQRDYVVVKGSLNSDNLRELKFDDIEYGLRFSAYLPDYIIDSDFFPPDTRITQLQGNILTLSKEATITGTWSSIEKEVTALEKKFNNYNKNKSDFVSVGEGSRYQGMSYYSLSYGVSNFIIRHNYYPNDGEPTVEFIDEYLPRDMARSNNLINDIKDEISKRIRLGLALMTESTINEDTLLSIASEIAPKVLETMQYVLKGPEGVDDIHYYDYGNVIRANVEQRTKEMTNVYIPFYTKKIISDKYPIASDGFTFEIASDKSDAIQWLALNKSLIVGTEMSEWVIPSGITALNLQAILNSRYGSDHIQGTAIGDAVCFFQSGKKSLVEYYIPQQDTNFRANNMVMMNEEIFLDAVPVEFDFMSTPFTRILITLTDGSLAVLLYERRTGTFAWGHFRMKHGKILSAATFPGRTDNDEAYLLVKQGIKCYLEYYRQNDPVFLDSYSLESKPIGEYVEGEKRGGFIGEPIEAVVRSMPILGNDKMKPQNIKSLQVRFHDSYLPKVKSSYGDTENAGKTKEVKTDTIPNKEPYTGIIKVPFPGVYEHDVFIEFVHDKPTRCQILAVNAEAN